MDENAIPMWQDHVEQLSGNIVRIERVISAYNQFVDALDEHVMNEAIINPAGSYGPNSLQEFSDLALLSLDNESSAFDKILMDCIGLTEEGKENDAIKNLGVISIANANARARLFDWYVHKGAYNALNNDDDKKKSRRLAAASHQYRYNLLCKQYDAHISKEDKDGVSAYTEDYLKIERQAIEEGLLYNKRIDLNDLNRYDTNGDQMFYSLIPFETIVQRISPRIHRMTDDELKTYFRNIFIRMVHLAMSSKGNGNQLIAAQNNVFGEPINNSILSDNTTYLTDNFPQHLNGIGDWLENYHDRRDEEAIRNTYFSTLAIADSDYCEYPADDALKGHFKTSLNQIKGELEGTGILYSNIITKFIVAKLERELLRLENSAHLTPDLSVDLDSFVAKAGLLLQGLHHCVNGRMELISKMFPSLVTAEDFDGLNADSLFKVILKLSSLDAMTIMLHFYDNTRGMTHYENAHYYSYALSLLRGRYGAPTGAVMVPYEGLNYLRDYFNKRQELWNELPREVQNLINTNTSINNDIVSGLMKVGASPSRLINILVSEKYVSITDKFIEKYLNDRNIQNYDFSPTERKKQILADAFSDFGVLIAK